jgi:hypothetical protein
MRSRARSSSFAPTCDNHGGNIVKNKLTQSITPALTRPPDASPPRATPSLDRGTAASSLRPQLRHPHRSIDRPDATEPPVCQSLLIPSCCAKVPESQALSLLPQPPWMCRPAGRHWSRGHADTGSFVAVLLEVCHRLPSKYSIDLVCRCLPALLIWSCASYAAVAVRMRDCQGSRRRSWRLHLPRSPTRMALTSCGFPRTPCHGQRSRPAAASCHSLPPSRPLRCRSLTLRSAANLPAPCCSFARVNFAAKIWICLQCFSRNHFLGAASPPLPSDVAELPDAAAQECQWQG